MYKIIFLFLITSVPAFAATQECKSRMKAAGLVAVEKVYGPNVYSSEEATVIDHGELKKAGTSVTIIEYWSPFDVPQVSVITERDCHVLSATITN